MNSINNAGFSRCPRHELPLKASAPWHIALFFLGPVGRLQNSRSHQMVVNLFDFPFGANSSSCRIASECAGLAFCCLAQLSIAELVRRDRDAWQAVSHHAAADMYCVGCGPWFLLSNRHRRARGLLAACKWGGNGEEEVGAFPRRPMSAASLCILVANAAQPKLGSFCNTCVAVVYFSPRLLCRFDLVVRAISIRRRIASDREGLSFWCLAQVSIADLRPIGSRTVRVGSCPVAGRPRPRFFCVTGIDSLPILCDT
jgi:hypothetical protein